MSTTTNTTKGSKKETTKATTKKAATKATGKKQQPKAKPEVKAKGNSKGKTELILKMVEQGKTRKDIIDKLVAMDDSISRKSNAALVSRVFKAHELLGKVPSGVNRTPKVKVKVKEGGKKKPATEKKAS